jgi:hypothetical protein
MIEGGRIEGAEFTVQALVLDVAPDAIARDVPVHALLQPDPLGDGLVARQAQRGDHFPAGFMTFLAVARAFEGGVRLRQGAWRDQLPDLRRPGAGRHEQAGGQQDGKTGETAHAVRRTGRRENT